MNERIREMARENFEKQGIEVEVTYNCDSTGGEEREQETKREEQQ